MITPYLEELIRSGAAKYRSMAIGGSGVGTIPVQQNEKVVITDFTWNPFCDIQALPIGSIDYFPIVSIHVQVVDLGIISPDDSVDGYIGLLNVGTMIVTSYVGSLLTGYIISGKFAGIDNVIDTTSAATGAVIDLLPGANIIPPGAELLDLSSGANAVVTSNITTFGGGVLGWSPGRLILTRVDQSLGLFSDTDPLSTVDFFPDAVAIQDGGITITADPEGNILLAIDNCIHHLRFKSKGVEEIFNFRDTPTPIIPLIQGEGFITDLFGFSLPDPIQVHCYMTFQETVQIDIWKFSPSGNIFLQQNPSPTANEPEVPNGYFNASANPPVFNITSGQGASIFPLGMRENTNAVPRKKDQFVDDIGDLTELNLPFSNQSFPLVNIGYVLIDNSVK